MTISLAWVRRLPDTEELIFASDSRLTGGYRWDTAQKIFPLPGLNAIISFAGDTALALPIIHQIRSSCENFHGLNSGSVELHGALGHVLRIVNSMRSEFVNADIDIRRQMDRETEFIFGGYSYLKQQMAVWTLRFNARIDAFSAKRAFNWSPVTRRTRKIFCFAGNYYQEYMKRLAAIAWDKEAFDFEPLGVLVEMLGEPAFDRIGGAPQILKVYPYRNYLPFAVHWPHRGENKVHLFGRPFMSYEKTTFPIMNTATMKPFYPLEGLSNFPQPLQTKEVEPEAENPLREAISE